MVKTAELMLEMRHPDKYGLDLSGEVRINWESTVRRKDKVVDGLVNGLNGLMKSRKVDVINGHGTITSPRTIMVDGREKCARAISSSPPAQARCCPQTCPAATRRRH